MNFDTATEKELRDAEEPQPKTLDELRMLIDELENRDHDYGTCVYAVSIAATATFNYMAHKLGITGFQASCADMDIIKRTRSWKHGFQMLNYENLLYPQYRDKFDAISFASLAAENKEWLAAEAKKKLAESPQAHPQVVEHWRQLAAL